MIEPKEVATGSQGEKVTTKRKRRSPEEMAAAKAAKTEPKVEVKAEPVKIETEPVIEKPTETIVKEVKTEPVKERPLQEGDTYLVKADGKYRYYTKTLISVAFQRGTPDIELPKGSPIQTPVNAKCSTCG